MKPKTLKQLSKEQLIDEVIRYGTYYKILFKQTKTILWYWDNSIKVLFIMGLLLFLSGIFFGVILVK